MQPKLADCFVVPKKYDCILVFRKFFFFFYHAVFIMRIDYDCMFEEIMLVVQILLQLFLRNSIYFFLLFFVVVCCSFSSPFHSVINRSPGISVVVLPLNYRHLCSAFCSLLTSCFVFYS